MSVFESFNKKEHNEYFQILYTENIKHQSTKKNCFEIVTSLEAGHSAHKRRR